MDLFHTNSRAGFGFSHDGSVDSLVRFVQDSFELTDDQQTADLVAFLLSVTGSGLPGGSLTDRSDAPGVASLDTPACVGLQVTVSNSAPTPQANLMIALAGSTNNPADLVVKGTENGLARGWLYIRSGGFFQSDRLAETATPAELAALATARSPLTYTLVPAGSGERIGIDRDADGYFDRDELDAGSDPANPLSIPAHPPPRLGLVAISIGTNAVALSWNAVSGLVCELQYKSHLADPAWISLSTNTAGIGAITAADTSPPPQAARFYRVVSP